MDTLTKHLVAISEVGVVISLDSEVNLTYPMGSKINNGNWHYVAVTLAEGQATVLLNGNAGSTESYTPIQPPV